MSQIIRHYGSWHWVYRRKNKTWQEKALTCVYYTISVQRQSFRSLRTAKKLWNIISFCRFSSKIKNFVGSCSRKRSLRNSSFSRFTINKSQNFSIRKTDWYLQTFQGHLSFRKVQQFSSYMFKNARKIGMQATDFKQLGKTSSTKKSVTLCSLRCSLRTCYLRCVSLIAWKQHAGLLCRVGFLIMYEIHHSYDWLIIQMFWLSL